MKKNNLSVLFVLLLFSSLLQAQNLSINAGADLVSRYLWRGINMNDMPNIQPSLSLKYKNLQFGFWGSYGLSHLNPTDQYHGLSHEIDSWISYSLSLEKAGTVSLLITDYYYANAGIRLGNFNNHDDTKGPGAHLVEAGLSYSGTEQFPFSLAVYYNVHNDKGNNTYFQADYLTSVQNVDLDLFLGASAGSTKTPAFYGTEKFNVINLGVKATKQIKLTESFSLPVYCTYIINPRVEASYLVLGITF